MLPDVKKSVVFNMKTARGQLDGILRMIEEDRYCIDISKQILAAQALLKKANREVLRGHIKTCVKSALKKGDGEKKLDEIFETLDSYGRE